MTLVTNDCLAYFIYKKQEIEYESPFISSLFEDDCQYLKFCQNYKKYIKKTPILGKPKLPVTVMNRDKVPVMFLGDVEIHWPHNSEVDVIEKFKKRLERGGKPLFIWSDMQIFNKHTIKERKELIKQFKAIPNSIFIKKNDIEQHKAQSIKSRSSTNYMNVPTWLDYPLMADHIIKKYL